MRRKISLTPDFFFQAEDGIRDYKVTGVQTCALPISRDRGRLEAQLADVDGRVAVQALQALQRLVPDSDSSLSPRARTLLLHPDAAVRSVRSEERRVGKECRARLAGYH